MPLDRSQEDPGEHLSVPPVSTALIEPVSISDAQPLDEEGSTWNIAAVGALESGLTGAGVKVAVLDTGIDATHEAFSNVHIMEKDFTGEGTGDPHGHGTHCAATIFGRGVTVQQYSVAPGVTEVLVGKVLPSNGPGSTESIAAAVLWAVEQGASVVSMSIGIDFPGYVKKLKDRGLPEQASTSMGLKGYRDNLRMFERLAELVTDPNAFGQGALLIAAAGNESVRDDPEHPYTIDVSPPAASSNFVSVGAVDRGGENAFDIASFSNTGPSLVAPGVNIHSARSGGGYALMSGTSMATPHVAGVAALWAELQLRREGLVSGARLSSQILGNVKHLPWLTNIDAGGGLVMAPNRTDNPTS